MDEIYNAPSTLISNLKDPHFSKAKLLSSLSQNLADYLKGEKDYGQWPDSIYGLCIGRFLVPQKKRKVALPLLTTIKELMEESGIFCDDTHCYNTKDYHRQFSQWNSFMIQQVEVDLIALKHKYIDESTVTNSINATRKLLAKYLFQRYEQQAFDEFQLKEICEAIQDEMECRCGRVVFALYSDHGVCELCERNIHGRYSIYLGEVLTPNVEHFCLRYNV